MARPAVSHSRRKECGTVTVVSPARKSILKDNSTLSATKVKGGNPSSRVDKNGKVKKTVSAAAVFSKKFKETDRDKKKRKKERHPLDQDLFVDFKDGLDAARAVMEDTAVETFGKVFEGLMSKLEISKSKDEALFENVAEQLQMLSASLVAERIEQQITKNGKTRTETVTLEQQIKRYKESIETEDAKLKELWKQWEDIQNEFHDLGLEVFGPEMFGEDPSEAPKDGFKKEMDLLGLAFNRSRNDLVEEIEENGWQVLEKFQRMDKWINEELKKEQTKLIQNLYSL